MPQVVPVIPLLLIDGSIQHQSVLEHSPYTIGRLPDRDLILSHPYVSREHAQIVFEDGAFFIVDAGSRHGTYVNEQRIVRHRLESEDSIRLGSLQGPLLRFGVKAESSSTIRDLLGQIQAINSPNSDLEKLRWFLEAARKLNNVGAVDQILASLVETTLQLTRVERGYVFLKDAHGKLELAVGKSSTGENLLDDLTISHTAIQQATRTNAEFIVTDTLTAESGARSESMVAQSIRTLICIPLRSRRSDSVRPASSESDGALPKGEILGVLYLDSRLMPGKLTQVDSDLLETIATEAAALVENANLARAEEAARRYRDELNIAAGIQQGLMAVQIPDLAFAALSTRNVPCKEIGGDFFDVVADEDSVYVVIADVSGKGVSAALMASTLQGLIYSQLLAHQSLDRIAALVNRYICAKDVGKYATMVMLKLTRRGQLEYINCGHVHPLLIQSGTVQRLSTSNLPVGLLAEAEFESDRLRLEPGARILVVTDGVTEAENPAGEFYGDQRLEEAALRCTNFEEIFLSVQHFANTAPATDDCTMLEMRYTQPA